MDRDSDAVAHACRTIGESAIVDMLVLYGWPQQAHSDLAGMRARAQSALDGWMQRGLPFATTPDGSRAFDPVEVIRFYKEAAFRGDDTFWPSTEVRAGRRTVQSLGPAGASEDEPPQFARWPERQFALTVVRTYRLRDVAAGAPLRLRLPQPVVDAGGHDLRIEDWCSHALSYSSQAGPQWRGPAPNDPSVTVAARYTFRSRPRVGGDGVALRADERDLYTRPQEGFVNVTPRIAALAARVAPGSDARETLAALYGFILDELRCSPMPFGPDLMSDPIGTVLTDGWFDCQLGSALLVSLLRARGIPARLCGGYFLARTAPTLHYWSEVYLEGEGWFPVDLSAWDLSRAGKDPKWRMSLFGALDYRLKTEVLPRHFTGLSSVRVGPSWRVIAAPCETGGIRVGLIDALRGEIVYEERIVSETLDSESEGERRPIRSLHDVAVEHRAEGCESIA